MPKRSLESAKSSYRYISDNNGGWTRIANNDTTRAFQSVVAKPSGNITEFVPEYIDNSSEAVNARDKYFATHDSKGRPTNQGLRTISPEFDIITLGGVGKEAISRGLGIVRKGLRTLNQTRPLTRDISANITRAATKYKEKLNEREVRRLVGDSYVANPPKPVRDAAWNADGEKVNEAIQALAAKQPIENSAEIEAILQRRPDMAEVYNKAKSNIGSSKALRNRNYSDVPNKNIKDGDITLQLNGNSISIKTDKNGHNIITDASFFNPYGDPNALINNTSALAKKGDKSLLASKHYSLSTNSLPLYNLNLARRLQNLSDTGLKITPTGNRVLLNKFGGYNFARTNVPQVLTDKTVQRTSETLERSYRRLEDAYNLKYPDSPISFGNNIIYFDGTQFRGPGYIVEKLKEGGSIHIAPSKRGTFTAVASKHGMGVQEFASKVLRNKDSYDY